MQSFLQIGGGNFRFKNRTTATEEMKNLSQNFESELNVSGSVGKGQMSDYFIYSFLCSFPFVRRLNQKHCNWQKYTLRHIKTQIE